MKGWAGGRYLIHEGDAGGAPFGVGGGAQEGLGGEDRRARDERGLGDGSEGQEGEEGQDGAHGVYVVWRNDKKKRRWSCVVVY